MNKYWGDYEETGILILYWWVPKPVRPLTRITDQDLSKLYFAHLSLASEVPPLRIYLNLSHIRLVTS